jgi:hypothetical protein
MNSTHDHHDETSCPGCSARNSLRGELEPLGDLVDAAMAALTDTDLQWGIAHLERGERHAMLSALGLPPDMRNPNKTFASQALAKLIRATPRVRRRAALVITMPVTTKVGELLERGEMDYRAYGDELVAEYPQGIARLFLARQWDRISVLSPLLLCVLMKDERLVLGVWSPFAPQIVAACEAAIQEYGELVDVDELADVEGDEEYDEDTDSSGKLVARSEQALATVREAFQNASAAVADVNCALEIGVAPPATALAVIASVEETLRNVAELVGLEVPPDPTLERIESAVAEGTKDFDKGVREALVLLTTAYVAADVPARALDVLAREAADLLASVDWSEEQRRRADALAGVAALVDAVRRDDEEVMARLHDEVSEALHVPAALLIAIARGRVTFVHEPTTEQSVEAGEVAPEVEANGAEEAVVPVKHVASDADVFEQFATEEDEEAQGTAEITAPVIDATIAVDFASTAGPEETETTEVVGESVVTLVVGQESPSETEEEIDVAAEIVDLLAGHRFGLAAWMVDAAGGSTGLVIALRAAALADALRTSSGPSAAALDRQAPLLVGDALNGERAGQVLALVAALRTALLYPQGAMTGVIVELTGRTLGVPGLSEVAAAVVHSAQRGLSLTDEVLPSASSAASLEAEVAAAASAAAAALIAPRASSFARGRMILDEWYSSGGVVTSLLGPAANDDDASRAAVEALVRRFNDRREVEEELDRVDRLLRGHGSRRVEGRVRQVLIDRLQECVKVAERWLEATSQLTAFTSAGGRWQAEPLRELRDAVKLERERLLGALRSLESEDPVVRAAGEGAAMMLEEVFGLLDGHPLDGTDPGPAVALSGELLKSSRVALTEELEVEEPGEVSLEAVLDAASRDWREGFEDRCAHDDFVSAAKIIERADDADVAAMSVLLEERQRAARERLDALRQPLERDINEARRSGYVDEDEWRDLTAIVNFAGTVTRGDLGRARQEFEDAAATLSTMREHARESFDTDFAEKCRTIVEVADRAEMISRMAEQGDLATARDIMARAEAGDESLPFVALGANVSAFYPAVPEALAAGLSEADVQAARDGGTIGPLDFSSQSEGERVVATRGLKSWLDTKMSPTARPTLTTLAPALRLLGIEADTDRVPQVPGGPGRRWLDLQRVQRTGRALVPAFGTASGAELRLLCCWGNPDMATVLGWIGLDPLDHPVVVLYFGTLSIAQRQALARSLRARPGRPVIVVDDAVVAYLAAEGAGLFETLMYVTLPFAATNPYEPYIAGSVPTEMFYGRLAERRSITDPRGTSLIYGGRQLGKSALLHAAERRFEEAPGHVAIYVSLDTSSGGSTIRPEAMWDLLVSALLTKKVAARRPARREAQQAAEDMIREWLEADADHRLLLLLDECDDFFNADSEVRFVNTTRLRDLMNSTGRRFKVVFAGLYKTQRFAVIPNQPLAHLGQPQVIGPLGPQPARDLLQRPIEALGFELSDDLAARLMANANYQPLALQVYGQALVAEILKHPVGVALPIPVTYEDVDAVLSNQSLSEEIRQRFELTLRLDHRYRVIAYTMAQQALELGHEQPITAEALRRECQYWWPDGFSRLRPDEFRGLVEEMAGLGVLATVATGWRLRSPNLLRYFGTIEQIEEVLVASALETPPPDFASTVARRLIDDATGVHSPLSESQLAGLLSTRGKKVQIVLGSRACGVSCVSVAIAAATEGGSTRVIMPGDKKGFRRALKTGDPGDHVIVVSALSASNEAYTEALETVLATESPERVERSVIVVVSEDNLDWWPVALSRQDEDVAIVELRRYDPQSLWVWAVDVASVFQDDRSRQELLKVTGGWPILIDRVWSLARAGHVNEEILTTLRLQSEDAGNCADLLDAVGLDNDQRLAALWATIIEFGGTPETLADLADLVADSFSEPERAVEALRALGVLEVDEKNRLYPEPVFRAAWQRVHHTPGQESL